MKNSIYLFYIFILLFTLPTFSQDKKNETVEVLFVGNSFTYFWNMPQMVNAMGKLGNDSFETYQSTVGGSTFKQHYNREKGTRTRDYLDSKKWDYVILQDHSLGSVEEPEDFIFYGTNLVNEVRIKNAIPILFLTWAYHSNPLNQPIISEKYSELAKKLNVPYIPVGEIFMKARELRPDLNMYFDDRHPSSDASYLIALIFYKALTGKTVSDIPDRLTSIDENGENIILSFVLNETGNFFRQLVNEFPFEPNQIIKR